MAKIFEWVLNYDDAAEAVEAIGVVDDPAIGVNFKFSEKKEVIINEDNFADMLIFDALIEDQKNNRNFEIPEDRMASLRESLIVVGPVMVPDDLIVRSDENGDPFWVYFSEDSVRNASYAFQKHNNQEQFNLNHDSSDPATGAVMVETWLIEDPEQDKAKYFGYNLPKGTWMISLKFDDAGLYENYIQSGELRGFSVELGDVTERLVFKNSQLKWSTAVNDDPSAGTAVN